RPVATSGACPEPSCTTASSSPTPCSAPCATRPGSTVCGHGNCVSSTTPDETTAGGCSPSHTSTRYQPTASGSSTAQGSSPSTTCPRCNTITTTSSPPRSKRCATSTDAHPTRTDSCPNVNSPCA